MESNEVPPRYEIRYANDETGFATSLDEARELIRGRADDETAVDLFPAEIRKAGVSDVVGAGEVIETVSAPW